MTRRRITISCPGCRDEFRDITVDEAEGILFNGCLTCRESSSARRTTVEVDHEELERAAREVDGEAE